MNDTSSENPLATLNLYMQRYLDAASNNDAPELLQSYLTDLLREVIRNKITLTKLLEVFSTSGMLGTEELAFTDNISSQYIRGQATAQDKINKDEERTHKDRTQEKKYHPPIIVPPVKV